MKSARLIGGMSVLILALFAVGSISCGQIAEPEIHLIPAGYMGNVYIFHNVPDGEPLSYEGRARVYKIPKDGILRSQGPLNEGPILSSQQYFYLTPDGKREKITGYWDTSIHDTAENRADKTLGIFFPRTGSLTGLTTKDDGTTIPKYTCDIRYDQYYVGTKLFLLTHSDLEKDLHAYVKEHPICK